MPDYSLSVKAAECIKEAGESGIFLIAGKDKPNAMTIGWSSAGVMWGLPVMCVPVRHSRYTHEILDGETAFTVFVPKERNNELVTAFGTVSGRNHDKIKDAGLVCGKSPYVDAPMIRDKGTVIHARILYKVDMTDKGMDEKVKRWYPDGDLHTLYYGEIIAVTEYL